MTKSPVSQSIETRPYRTEDYAACRELWRELADHHRMTYDDPDIGGDDPGSGLDTYLADPKRVESWVATQNDTVLGLTGMLLFDEGEFEVEPVIVSSSDRGHGIGRSLIEQVFTEARERGLHTISVRAVARNAEAMAFYRHMGFRSLGLIELIALLDAPRATWLHGVEFHGESYEY